MADGTIIIDTKLDVEGIEGGTKKINKSFKEIDIKDLDKQLTNVGKSIENTTQKIELQQQKLSKLKEAYKNATNVDSKNKINEQIINTESSIIKLENQIDKLNSKKIKIELDKKAINGLDGEFRSANMKMTKEFQDAAQKSQKSISDMTNKSKTHFSNLANAAKTSITGIATVVGTVGTAGIGLGAAIGKIGSDFESQMSRVKAISGATTEEFKKLQDQAIQLGADTSFSSKEAAEGMENLASAGFTTNEIMSAMPGLLDLAASSGETLASSSEIAAGTLRGFGLEADQAGHVADVLAKNASATNAAVADTGEAMKYVAPVAHSMGLSLEEVTAAIGEMSNANIKGSQAGTTLRSALTRLASPADPAATAMQKIGFNAFDAQGKLKNLSTIMDEYGKALEGKTDKEKQDLTATIFGQEAMSGMLVLMQGGKEGLDKLTESYKNSDGAAKEMAKTMKDNLKGSMDQLTGSLESLALQLYYSVDNPMKNIVDTANDMIGQLSTAFKNGGFEGLTESLGSVLAQIVKDIAQNTPKIIDGAVNVVKSFVKGIRDNMKEISKGAIDIVIALVNGILDLTPEILDIGLKLVINLAKGISDNLPTLIPKITNFIEELVKIFTDNAPLLIEVGIKLNAAITQGMIQAIPEILKAIPQINVAIIQAFAKADWSQIGKDIIKNMFSMGATDGANFAQWAKKQAATIKTTFKNQGLKEAIKQTLATINPSLNETGVNFAAWAKIQVKAIKDEFKNGGLKAAVKQTINSLTPGVGEGASNFATWAKVKVTEIKTAFQNGGLKEVAKQIVKDLTPDGVEKIAAKIEEAFKELPSKIKKIFNEIVSNIIGWGNDSESEGSGASAKIIKAIIDPFNLMPEGVGSHFERLKTNLTAIYLELTGQGTESSKETVNKIVEAFETLPSRMLETGGHIVDGLRIGIENKWSNLTTWLGEKCTGFIGGVNSIFKIKSPSRVFMAIGGFIMQGWQNGMINNADSLLSTASNISNNLINTVQEPLKNLDLAKSMLNGIGNIKGSFDKLANEITASKNKLEQVNLMSIDNDEAYNAAKENLDKIKDLEAGKKKAISQESKKIMEDAAEKELEAAKKEAELKILVAKNAAEQEVNIANDKKNRITKLAEATTEAIKNQLTQQKETELKTYDDELTALENKYNKETDLIDKSTDKKKTAIDKQIAALEEASTKNTRNEERQTAKDNINVLKTEMANTKSQADKDALALQIKNAKKDLNSKEDTWSIEDKRAALEQEKTLLDTKATNQKESLRKEYEAQKTNIEKQKQATEEYYNKLLETDSLNAQARYTMLTTSNDNLVRLLNSYAPKWQDAGQTLADSLVDGLNSNNQSVTDAVGELVSIRDSSNSISGYASGTSYNKRGGLYNVDEEGFEINTNDKPVAYVSEGAAISNKMQSLAAIKEEISKRVDPLSSNLKSALYSEQSKMANMVSSTMNNINNTNNQSSIGNLLNVEHFHNDNQTPIAQLAHELSIFQQQQAIY